MTMEERFWLKVAIGADDECWEWLGAMDGKGYGNFKINGERNDKAHRIAWSLGNGSVIPRGMYVCHSCDNPPCCNPLHLWVGTPQQNMDDCKTKGRIANGSRVSASKLGPDDVEQIRRLRSSGWTFQRIGDLFGITRQSVYEICTYRTWKTQPARRLVSQRVGSGRVE